jgi:hypothetical protein
MNRESSDQDYLRGLVGARLANKDNWVIFVAGSKKFVHFIADRPLPMSDGVLLIRPHPVVAGDVPGHPELWVMVGAQPKKTDPVEAERERAGTVKLLRLMGFKGRIRPEQDILLLIEPNAPRWAERLVQNYVQFICTGEGSMEPH